jgi:hypothetical protein
MIGGGMRFGFLVIALFITGCATRTDLNGLKKAQDDSRQVLDRVESKAANIPGPIMYEVYDISRGKSVGWVGVGVHISTGDRIFLNDDIWEVKAVKMFTSPSGNAKELPAYRP